MSRLTDAIIGKTPTLAASNSGGNNGTDIHAALAADAAEPDSYRPYLTKPHPQVMFSVIERDGTETALQYHTLRAPKFHRRNNEEFLSFTADGLVVVAKGSGLRAILLALKRYALFEMREYDGKPPGELPTRIDRLEVVDAQEQLAKSPSPRLVK